MTSSPLLRIALFAILATVARGDTPFVAAPESYLAEIGALLDTSWPKNRIVNIVCHGHSVPAGYFHTPTVDTFNAYPHLLHEKLKAAARFERDVLSLRPDVITIDYALNDRRVGLEKVRAAWTEMITKAKAAGIKVILLTPSPDKSAKLAAENGVALSDSLAAFKRALKDGAQLDDLMAQINHPNRKGHELIAGELWVWFQNRKPGAPEKNLRQSVPTAGKTKP